MALKIYSEKKEQVQNVPAKPEKFYDTPKLIRRAGIYYIGYETDEIQIEEWEAATVYEHPEYVYDLIISYRRKFYFNTAEDSPMNM